MTVNLPLPPDTRIRRTSQEEEDLPRRFSSHRSDRAILAEQKSVEGDGDALLARRIWAACYWFGPGSFGPKEGGRLLLLLPRNIVFDSEGKSESLASESRSYKFIGIRRCRGVREGPLGDFREGVD